MRLWRIWARTLGPKVSESDREADLAALYRTAVGLLEIATCIMIISGVLHHW